LSGKINELLGFKDNPIDLAKLTKEDLGRLYEAVESLSLGGGILGKKLLNRPVGELMDMRLRDVFKEVKEGKGILGLGIASEFLNIMRKRGEKKE